MTTVYEHDEEAAVAVTVFSPDVMGNAKAKRIHFRTADGEVLWLNRKSVDDPADGVDDIGDKFHSPKKGNAVPSILQLEGCGAQKRERLWKRIRIQNGKYYYESEVTHRTYPLVCC